jgi:cellulose biosynthesis protein BcsQ
MTKVIVFTVRKGGEGKTTLSTCQAGLLSKKGKTLIIDLDAQGHVIKTFGYEPSELTGRTIMDVVNKNVNYQDILFTDKHHNFKNLDILASNSSLGAHSKEIGGSKKIANLISKIIKSNKYEYIVIDTAPAFTDLS